MDIRRNFSGSDAYLIESGITTKALFDADIASFTGFSTKFDAAYSTAFQAAIDAAFAAGTNETAQDEQAELTHNVVTAMRDCFKKYAEIKFFAEQAFPGNIERQNQFGTNDYQKARKSQAMMIVFMDTMHTLAQRYKTELIAKGCTQAKIDEILTLRDAYIDANRQQDVSIKLRPGDTRERIITLNDLYFFINTVNSAAQVIWYDNDAKKSAYVYLPSTSTSTIVKTGNIAAHTNVVVDTVTYRANRNITFTNTGDAPLFFGLATEGDIITGVNVELPPRGSATLRMDEMLEDGTLIICANKGDEAGSYEVEYEN